jgi:hypothetical protein
VFEVSVGCLVTACQPDRIHTLKAWPEQFWDVRKGIKTAELRRDDRGFAVGDAIDLREGDPIYQTYSGQQCLRVVTHILRGCEFGLQPGFVMLSFCEPSKVYP